MSDPRPRMIPPPGAVRLMPKHHVEFNLSSCLQLKELRLEGGDILLKDSSSRNSSKYPVWIVLKSAEPIQCGDPPPDHNTLKDLFNTFKVKALSLLKNKNKVLPSIQYIELKRITGSHTWLRNLFSTLLTLDHAVKCTLEDCHITWPIDDHVRQSSTYVDATIRTGVNNALHMNMLFKKHKPRKIRRVFFEALCGLNIKWLGINGLNEEWVARLSESLLKTLQSLTQLETLNMCVDEIGPNVWKALHCLSQIKFMTLSQKGMGSGLIVNNSSRLSQVRISLTHMKTIYTDVNAQPGLLKVLHGLNIKSLSLCESGEIIEVNHASALFKWLWSLKQLDKLDVIVNKDSPGLWKALHGLNIKSLSLSGGLSSLGEDYVSALAELLASLKQLETLRIEVYKDKCGLWEAIRGLNIKCLSVSSLRGVDYLYSMSKSLASLTSLVTLRMKVTEYRCELWEALHGLNIKGLCLFGSDLKGDVISMSQSLLSLPQLTTLSIKVPRYSDDVFKALRGLNITSLHLNDWCEGALASHLQLESSLPQLETLTLYVRTYEALELPKSLKYLNIYCGELFPSQLRKLVHKLSACTQIVELKLECACAFNHITLTEEKYIAIQQELLTMKNVKVTRFLIYTWKPSRGTCSDWCVQKVVVDVNGHHDDDIGDDELYQEFIDNLDELNRLSIRLYCI